MANLDPVAEQTRVNLETKVRDLLGQYERAKEKVRDAERSLRYSAEAACDASLEYAKFLRQNGL